MQILDFLGKVALLEKTFVLYEVISKNGILNLIFKNLKSFFGKKDAFDCNLIQNIIKFKMCVLGFLYFCIIISAI